MHPVLTVNWFLFYRQHKLDESLAYQQFSANVGEEESWINEKNTLVGSDDYGDTLAAVQVRQLWLALDLPDAFCPTANYERDSS